MSARIAVVTSRLRVEEKLLLTELERRGADFVRVDDAALALPLGGGEPPAEVVWNRSVAYGRTLYATRAFEAQGAICVNPSTVVETCGDKAATTLALEGAGVPTLRTTLAFTPESALAAMETMGWPVVLKPVVGSWGRLVAKLDSPTAAEAVLEDRAVLGSWQQQIFYVQEYVAKPGRDLRVFVIGDEPVAAIARYSEHWITNTARGGRVEGVPSGGELGELALAAARAVGGGILAVDLVETPDGPKVLEVNHSGEFRNSIEPTGVDLPGAMVDCVLSRSGRSGGVIRVSIAGASGYVGGELLRLLLRHPEVEVAQVTSESRVGQLVRSTHPNLRGWTDMRFTSMDSLEPCDALFLALPHGESSKRIEALAGIAERIVDCSADFRLADPGVYEDWYKAPHTAPDWLERFVYGLPEANRESLRGARYASGVGCNATAANLALLPLVRAGLLDENRPVTVDLKVGSSEAGRSASASGQHAERAGVVRSFSPTGHRHTAEVLATLGIGDVHLSVTSVEIVRGALATAHAWLGHDATDKDLWAGYRATYGEEPFVRIVHDRGGAYRHPEPRLVTGTNHADVGWELAEDGRRIVALCAIDNLVKGAAGTAVQCLNLMCGFEETAGLDLVGIHPQ